MTVAANLLHHMMDRLLPHGRAMVHPLSSQELGRIWEFPSHSTGVNSATLPMPASITTKTSLSEDGMTLDINFGPGYWRFEFVPVGTELTTYDLTLEVNTATLRWAPTGCTLVVASWVTSCNLRTTTGRHLGAVTLFGLLTILNSPVVALEWRLDGLECADLPTATTASDAVTGGFPPLWTMLDRVHAQLHQPLRRDHQWTCPIRGLRRSTSATSPDGVEAASR